MTHTPRIGGHATAGAHPSFSFLAFLPRGARYALWTLTQEPPLGGGKLYRYAFIPEKKHRRATAMSADFAEDSDGFIVFQCLCFTRQRPNKTVQSMKVEHHIFGSMSFCLSCCLSLSRSLPLSPASSTRTSLPLPTPPPSWCMAVPSTTTGHAW